MQDTARLNLPLLAANQAQKHVTHNEALQQLDALVHLSVLDRHLAAPPASPPENARYVIGEGGSGAWAGHDGDVALLQDGAWTILTPRRGWLAWVEDESALIIRDQDGWGPALTIGDLGSLGIATSADSTNRLAVASAASLFTHAGGGHQLKLNKASPHETASIVFQTGFSGRAEIGTTGGDDLRFKVSPDGISWRDALQVEIATGAVRLPGTASTENLLINADFRINQRGFGGGSLPAGSFGHDRWKADTGGASYTASAGMVTLASGTLVQVVEPAFHGSSNLAGRQVTLSVENPSADLFVTVGAGTATITTGTGRRSATIVLGAGETGNIPVKIARVSAGAVTFAQPKLEIGSIATPWLARSAPIELAFCQRYYVEFGNANDTYHFFGLVVMRSSSLGVMKLDLPVPMRAVPILSIAGGFGTLDGGGAVGNLTLGRFGWHYVEVTMNVPNVTAGSSWALYANNTGAARLRLSAEL